MESNRVSIFRVWTVLLMAIVFVATALGQKSVDAVNEIQRLSRTAQVATQQGRSEDAIRIHNQIIALSGGDQKSASRAHFNIGNTYMQMKKFDLAVGAFQRAVALDATLAEAQNNMGESLGELRQYPRALEAFSKAAAIDPGLSKARYNMGVTYDRLGQMKYAEFIYRHLIRDKPEYSLAYDGLAVTLSKSGRAREAIGVHEKAIALNPRDGSFYFNLAISYLILGNQAKAQEQQQRLRQIDPQIASRLAGVLSKRRS
jgi:tetratricopeptide (TPR) repeat protein